MHADGCYFPFFLGYRYNLHNRSQICKKCHYRMCAYSLKSPTWIAPLYQIRNISIMWFLIIKNLSAFNRKHYYISIWINITKNSFLKYYAKIVLFLDYNNLSLVKVKKINQNPKSETFHIFYRKIECDYIFLYILYTMFYAFRNYIHCILFTLHRY